MPPVTKKMLDKISDFDDLPKNNKIIKALKGGLMAFRKDNSSSPEKVDSPDKEADSKKLNALLQ